MVHVSGGGGGCDDEKNDADREDDVHGALDGRVRHHDDPRRDLWLAATLPDL